MLCFLRNKSNSKGTTQTTQQQRGLPVAVHSYQHLVLLSACSGISLFQLHFLMTYNGEHLSLHMFICHLTALVRYLLCSLTHFLNCFLIVEFWRVLFVYFGYHTFQIHHLVNSLWLTFSFPWHFFFAEHKFLILTKFGLSIISLMDSEAFGLYPGSCYPPNDHLGFLLCNSQVL